MVRPLLLSGRLFENMCYSLAPMDLAGGDPSNPTQTPLLGVGGGKGGSFILTIGFLNNSGSHGTLYWEVHLGETSLTGLRSEVVVIRSWVRSPPGPPHFPRLRLGVGPVIGWPSPHCASQLGTSPLSAPFLWT